MRFRNVAVLLLLLFASVLVAGCGGKKRLDAVEVLPVEQLYAEGKLALDNGNTDRAERYLQRLVARFPYGEYSELAQLDLAYAQYRERKYEEAYSSINRFIKLYPAHRNIDYAYYLRGLINFDRQSGLLTRWIESDYTRRDLNHARQSFQDFSELLKRYPNSRYASETRQRMVHLRNGLAQGELNTALFYFRREAFIAAINRAQFLVENYQETPQAGDALAILTESYARLGRTQQSKDARKVLAANYPQHPYLSGDRWPPRRKLWWQVVPMIGEARAG